MAQFGANLNLVPMSLKAKSEDELSKLMIVNNYANQMKFNYMSPVYAKGKWVVWFFADLTTWKNPGDLKEGDLLALGVKI